MTDPARDDAAAVDPGHAGDRATSPGERNGPSRGLLRHAGFRGYLAARTVSILGDRFTELALPLVVLAGTGSAVDAGLVGAAAQVPALALALVVGEAVDRVSRRGLMVGADLVRMAALVATAALAAGSHPNVWALAGLSCLVGLANLAFSTAASALLPGLVGRSRLLVANTWLEAGDAASSIVGPGLAGAVVAAFGAVWALVADGASFLLSAVLLAAVPAGPGRAAGAGAASGAGRPADTADTAGPRARGRLAGVAAGAAELVRRPGQRLVTVAWLVLNALSAAIVLLVVALVRDSLRLGPSALGAIVAGAGVGVLASSVLLAPRLDRGSVGPVLGLLLALAGAATAGLAASSGLVSAFLGNLVLDAMVSAAYVVAATARQRLTADHLLGRVAATSFVLTSGVRAVSVLLAGALIAVVGPRGALAAYAVLLLAAGGAVAVARAGRRPLATGGDAPADGVA